MYNHNIPTIKEKVRHMPHVYYFNLDHETDRKEYMESQLDRYGINYTRISQSKYLSKEYDSWRYKLDNPCLFDVHEVYEKGSLNRINHVASFITHLELFYDWYHNTNEDRLIIMEDDYDLSLIEQWHFTWKYLLDNLPYDWDALQFSFETSHDIHFFLHPRFWYDSGFGAMMLSRSYVNKLLNMFYDKSNRLKTDHRNSIHPDAPMPPANRNLLSNDNCIGGTGVTYRLPLVTMNYEMQRNDKIENNQSWIHHFYCEQITKKWWKHSRDKFSLDDFFMYGKPNDYLMTVKVNEQNAFF